MHSDDSSHLDDAGGQKMLILPLTTVKYNPNTIWIFQVVQVIEFPDSVTH